VTTGASPESKKALAVLIPLSILFGAEKSKLADLGLVRQKIVQDFTVGFIFSMVYVGFPILFASATPHLIPVHKERVVFHLLFGFVATKGILVEFFKNVGPLLFVITMTVVLGMVEEVYFRGVLINKFREAGFKRRYLYLAPATLFSVLHWHRGILCGIVSAPTGCHPVLRL